MVAIAFTMRPSITDVHLHMPCIPLPQPHHRGQRGEHGRLDAHAPLQQGHRPAGRRDGGAPGGGVQPRLSRLARAGM